MWTARQIRSFGNYFYKIPHAVPPWGHRELAAILNCLLTGQVASGPHTQQLGEKIKGILGVAYVLGFNSGRSAIEVAIRALGLNQGDEVIVSSFCCLGAVLPILRAGCIPVFADVDDTLNIDPEKISCLISGRTRAILVPHLFGRPARIDDISRLAQEHSLFVIDDAAQAFGATLYGKPVGGFGDVGIVSFGPGKTLVATGGGVLVTNHREVFLKARALSAPSQGDFHTLSRLIRFVMFRRLRRATLPFYAAYEHFSTKFF